MATETEQELKRELADERRELTEAVGSLREELGNVTARGKKVGAAVGAATGAAVAARLVLRLLRGRD
jgi:hypothetical protein